MATSIIKELAEDARKNATGDKNYAMKGNYVFVLHGPRGVAPVGFLGRAQFPLVINPESFEYTLPFAAELTPLQEGGVVSEEGGIVIGEISIQGSTGFKLRKNLGDTSLGRGRGQFTGELDPGLTPAATAA